ncbi:MAG: hypothetical protein AVDCRST_MAG68-4377, partial [uncultured Gemmatimonadetes bacterium]
GRAGEEHAPRQQEPAKGVRHVFSRWMDAKRPPDPAHRRAGASTGRCL